MDIYKAMSLCSRKYSNMFIYGIKIVKDVFTLMELISGYFAFIFNCLLPQAVSCLKTNIQRSSLSQISHDPFLLVYLHSSMSYPSVTDSS